MILNLFLFVFGTTNREAQISPSSEISENYHYNNDSLLNLKTINNVGEKVAK